MDDILEPAEQSMTILERTVHTSITLPTWANEDQISEAMEILDPGLDFTGWRGVHPGWGATTIYQARKQPA
jgi:hypothetical protein